MGERGPNQCASVIERKQKYLFISCFNQAQEEFDDDDVVAGCHIALLITYLQELRKRYNAASQELEQQQLITRMQKRDTDAQFQFL